MKYRTKQHHTKFYEVTEPGKILCVIVVCIKATGEKENKRTNTAHRSSRDRTT